MKQHVKKLLSVALSITTLTLLQACVGSPQSDTPQGRVANAFESSGTIDVKPYTRTIFSSNNF